MSRLAEKLEQTFGTLADLIKLHAEERPAHIALIFDERQVSFAELDGELDRVAASLQRDGLHSADVVAISAKNSLNFAYAALGASRAGLAVAPLAADMIAENLKRMIADSGAKLFFCDGPVAQMLAAEGRPLGVPVVTLDGAPDGQPWESWIAPKAARPQAADIQPDDAFNIIYSSGTTGVPKGIVVPFSFRWAQFKLFRNLNYGPASVAMVSIPLYSNMTLSSFLPPLAMGCTVVMMGKFDARRYLQLAERHRVTHAMMVPIQFQRILADPEFDRFDLGAFEVKSCGSAHFPVETKQDILKRWPGSLVEFYGMTEGGVVCALDARARPDKLHTVGHPLPGHALRIIDESGAPLPRGAVGEIVGRSPTMMIGYHNLPEKTREAEWFSPEGERFIRTGDVGRVDEDGFLTLMDRSKDMIISGGFNVYPSDLETVLRGHPDVEDVAVAGVPSAKWGETPVAFVIRKAGTGISAEELIGWSNARLNKPQRISGLRFVDELPRNGIGKVLKRQLRQDWLTG